MTQGKEADSSYPSSMTRITTSDDRDRLSSRDQFSFYKRW
jgi:hypothetical protein